MSLVRNICVDCNVVLMSLSPATLYISRLMLESNTTNGKYKRIGTLSIDNSEFQAIVCEMVEKFCVVSLMSSTRAQAAYHELSMPQIKYFIIITVEYYRNYRLLGAIMTHEYLTYDAKFSLYHRTGLHL